VAPTGPAVDNKTGSYATSAVSLVSSTKIDLEVVYTLTVVPEVLLA
jgi:hypothetical protein